VVIFGPKATRHVILRMCSRPKLVSLVIMECNFAAVYFEFACSDPHEIFTKCDQGAKGSIPMLGSGVGVGWGTHPRNFFSSNFHFLQLTMEKTRFGNLENFRGRDPLPGQCPLEFSSESWDKAPPSTPTTPSVLGEVL